MTVQGGRQVQALEEGPQDGQVGHDFHTQQARFAGVHPFNLCTCPISEKHPQHERTIGLVALPVVFGIAAGGSARLCKQLFDADVGVCCAFALAGGGVSSLLCAFILYIVAMFFNDPIRH